MARTTERDGERAPFYETIANYWRVLLPIFAFCFGCYVVATAPSIKGQIIGVVIAGFGPALRDVIAKW